LRLGTTKGSHEDDGENHGHRKGGHSRQKPLVAPFLFHDFLLELSESFFDAHAFSPPSGFVRCMSQVSVLFAFSVSLPASGALK
jgi:hypothetical protein